MALHKSHIWRRVKPKGFLGKPLEISWNPSVDPWRLVEFHDFLYKIWNYRWDFKDSRFSFCHRRLRVLKMQLSRAQGTLKNMRALKVCGAPTTKSEGVYCCFFVHCSLILFVSLVCLQAHKYRYHVHSCSVCYRRCFCNFVGQLFLCACLGLWLQKQFWQAKQIKA